jgi:AcrR family transcriptional regulator
MASKRSTQSARAAASSRAVRAVADRETWLEAARDKLIQSGIEAVKIEPLAAQLGISRSSFYWHFSNRQDLLDALLEHWSQTNTQSLRVVIDEVVEPGTDPTRVARKRLKRLADVFIDERGFSPRYDMAMRDWARNDAQVAARVAIVDQARIALFQRIFLDLGNSRVDSLIRARVLYFHQLGYYLAGIQESVAARHRLAPVYLSILSGLDF